MPDSINPLIISLDDFQEKDSLCIDHKQRRILICRNYDDEGAANYSAFVATCPHHSYPLSRTDVKPNHIRCPAHGAKFDRKTGEALCAPAFTGLENIPCKISNSYLRIEC